MKTRNKLAAIGFLALSFLLIPPASNSIAYAGELNTASICVAINHDNSEIRDSLTSGSDTLMYTTEGQIFEVVARFKDTLGVQLSDNHIGYIPISDTTPFVPIVLLNSDWVSNSWVSPLSLPKSILTKHNLFDLSAPITSVAAFKIEEIKVETEVEEETSDAGLQPKPQEPTEPKVETKQIQETKEQVENNSPKVSPESPTPEPTPKPVPEPAPEPEPVVEIKPSSDSLSYLSSEEKTMFILVNQVREDHGLQALKLDTQLVDLARLKAQDMINLDYFSHISPTYGSPIDMLKYFGIDYRGMGENLAGNQSVEKAHVALVNSPGHLENILNPDFTHMGIGIKTGGKYENIYTQLFIGKS